MKRILKDLRTQKGIIWNVDEVIRRFKFHNKYAPWNKKGVTCSDEDWIDDFIYSGFLEYGDKFLKSLHGRFSICVLDERRKKIFLLRDWIGEIPFHYLATRNRFIVANSIKEIKKYAKTEFSYNYVKSFHHSCWQYFDLQQLNPECVALTMRPETRGVYFDFEKKVDDYHAGNYLIGDFNFSEIRGHFHHSLKVRVNTYKKTTIALLLSGGLDSFTIAVALKVLNIPFECFTLSVNGNELGDIQRAREAASRLGIKHHVIDVTSNEIAASFKEAIGVSECYHLYNVYCAVGMHLLGKKLAKIGIQVAFCGEAVNEAIGDYNDWSIIDQKTNESVQLQSIDPERLQKTSERLVYVWGHSLDKGKYNRQLGSGLAKHAGCRMIKPFINHEIQLECPFYDSEVLSRIVALPPDYINEIGHKPGLMYKIFKNDFESLGLDQDYIRSFKKVRFQDATEGGKGGISEVLYAERCDQVKAIELFNEEFGSNLDTALDAKRLALSV